MFTSLVPDPEMQCTSGHKVAICPASDPEDTDLHLLGRSGDLTVGHAWSPVCGSSREEQHHLLTKNVMVWWMTGFWTCISV